MRVCPRSADLSAPRPLSPDLKIIFKQDKSRIFRFILKAQDYLFNTFTLAFETRQLRPHVPYFAYQVGRKFGAQDPHAFRVWGFLDGAMFWKRVVSDTNGQTSFAPFRWEEVSRVDPLRAIPNQ